MRETEAGAVQQLLVTQGPGFVEVTATFAGADTERLFVNLDDGLTARIEFSVRLLAPRTPPFAFFGPRVVREYRPTSVVRRDPFRERYVITTHDGVQYVFRDRAALLPYFFTLSAYRVPVSEFGVGPESAAADALSVEVRVVYEPLVFVPGLGILSIFMTRERQVTPWQRVSLAAGGG